MWLVRHHRTGRKPVKRDIDFVLDVVNFLIEVCAIMSPNAWHSSDVLKSDGGDECSMFFTSAHTRLGFPSALEMRSERSLLRDAFMSLFV